MSSAQRSWSIHLSGSPSACRGLLCGLQPFIFPDPPVELALHHRLCLVSELFFTGPLVIGVPGASKHPGAFVRSHISVVITSLRIWSELVSPLDYFVEIYTFLFEFALTFGLFTGLGRIFAHRFRFLIFVLVVVETYVHHDFGYAEKGRAAETCNGQAAVVSTPDWCETPFTCWFAQNLCGPARAPLARSSFPRQDRACNDREDPLALPIGCKQLRRKQSADRHCPVCKVPWQTAIVDGRLINKDGGIRQTSRVGTGNDRRAGLRHLVGDVPRVHIRNSDNVFLHQHKGKGPGKGLMQPMPPPAMPWPGHGMPGPPGTPMMMMQPPMQPSMPQMQMPPVAPMPVPPPPGNAAPVAPAFSMPRPPQTTQDSEQKEFMEMARARQMELPPDMRQKVQRLTKRKVPKLPRTFTQLSETLELRDRIWKKLYRQGQNW